MFILTEKPNVAESFAVALGGFTKKGGYWENKKGDCITSAQGHLLTLKMPEDYDSKYEKWDLSHLPIIPEKMDYKLIQRAGSINMYKTIRECMKRYDTTDFLLATDADREGELIGRLILKSLGFKNWNTARRFWVSEALEKEVVLDGIRNAKPLMNSEYTKLFAMGYARQHADWITGLNITRLLTCSVHKKLTFGRVQTAVLNAVCKRDNEIAKFVAEPYYQLYCNVVKDNVKFSMLYLNDGINRFKDRESLEKIIGTLKSGNYIPVTDVNVVEKKEEPPLLFDITELQKFCSNAFGYDPKQTLEAAQILYDEKKCLSYPRTASQYMGNDNVELMKEKYNLLAPQYPRQSKGCSTEVLENVSKRIFNSSKVEGHHALIPLAPLPPDCSDILSNVYNAVLLRFFQIFKSAYRYKSVEVTSDVGRIRLYAKGIEVIEEGWKVGVKDEENNSDDEEKIEMLPRISKGDMLLLDGSSIVQKKTKPKKAFTNASLLTFMKNPKNEDGENVKLVGLGTSATRAQIIDELIQNQYLCKSGRKIISTELGQFLINTVNSIPALASFIKVDNTTQWEKLLNDNPDSFLNNIKTFVSKNVSTKINVQWKAPEKEALGICPACKKGNVIEGSKGYYCSEYKTGCKFIVWKQISGAKVSVSDVKTMIAGKKTRIKKMKSKSGKDYSASLYLDGMNIKFSFENKK